MSSSSEPADTDADPDATVETARRGARARLRAVLADRRGQAVVIAALTVVAGGLLALGYVLSTADEPPPPKPDIPLDAWAPYWALDDSTPVAGRRVASMREISPFWFNATGATTIEVDPNAVDEPLDEFVRIARRSGAAVVPSIVDAMPPGGMAAVLADPDGRAAHVATLVEFAADGDYDGLDLDYEEFAFSDGRATWATTRPNWVTFVAELGERLRADGRTLTVSIPPVYDGERTADSGFWVYDHGAIAEHVDRIRLMVYDFSVAEPGPIAPLAFVDRSIAGALEAGVPREKLVLGLPAYGRNWPTGTRGDCTDAELPGVTGVNNRTVDELAERRDAVIGFDPATGESTFTYELEVDSPSGDCVQTRVVHVVDAEGVRLRMDRAREERLDGVALWAFGFEDEAVWDAILETVTDPTADTQP